MAVPLLLLPLLALPAPASPQDAARDSLEERIRKLETRIDSLAARLARLRAGPEEGADDDLARLREAAREAAEGGDEPEAEPGRQQSRTRSLQALNPEISITGDVVGTLGLPAEGGDDVGAVPREFEFSFQAALDPRTRTKVFVTREEEFEVAGLEPARLDGLPDGGGEGDQAGGEEEGHGFEVEEGYMYWVGLPGGLGARVGKFRQEIGLYNRWHNHALFEVDRPLAPVALLGEEGLIQTGAGLTFPSFTLGPATQTVTLEATLADNERLFDGGDEIGYLARLGSFWDLGPSAFFQLGATGVYGENGDADGLSARLLEVDGYFRWTPPGRSLYRDLQLKTAWYFGEKRFADRQVEGHGGYLQAHYRLGRQWEAGVRADYVDPFGPDRELVQIAPSVTWWQSEWVRLRLQLNWLDPAGGDPSQTILLQTVWAMGPHKHEEY